MKKGFFSVLLLVTMSLNVTLAGQTNVPAKIQETFDKMYPKVDNAEWRQDDDVYVVTFKVEEVEKESTFSKNGKWEETRSTLTAEVLSKVAKDAIAKKFPGSTLEEVIMVEKPANKKWEVWIETSDKDSITVVLNDKDKIVDSY